MKSEVESQKTNKEYLEILDSLRDGYLEADKNGLITYVNLPFVKELGYDKREEVIGKHFRHITNKKFARDVFEKFRTLYRTKQPLDFFETKYCTKDGNTFIGEAAVSPVFYKGEVVGTKGTIRNITSRVEAQKELSEQKDFLDALLNQTPIAVLVITVDKKISKVNPAFQKLFGYPQQEVIGQKLDTIFSWPETLEEMGEYTDNLGGGLYFTGQRKRKDGSIIDVEVFGEPFFVGNESFGSLIFYNNISERLKVESDLKETTTTYRTLLDTLQDPYFEADSTGYLTYVNKKFVTSTRYSNREELIGKHFRYLVSKKSLGDFIHRFKMLYKTNKSIEPFDLVYVTKDGLEFSSEVVVSPIVENYKTVGTRGIIRDISIRVKAEKLLREAKEAAEFRAGELASINRVAEKVSYSLDIQDVLDSVCKELVNIFPVRNAGISLLSIDKHKLEVLAYYSTTPDKESHQGEMIELEGNIDAQNLINTKRTVVIQEAQCDLRTKPIYKLMSIPDSRSFIIVPLVTRGMTIGLIGMTAKDAKQKFSTNEIELAETIASQIAASVDNAHLHTQTEIALDVAEQELEIGREIQAGFFPRTSPEIPGWEISTYFKAARQVSGDFYDVFPIGGEGKFVIVVADVCDKGVGAALFMVLLRSLIRSYSEQHQTKRDVENLLDNITVKVNSYIVNTHGHSNMFATMVLGILDPIINNFYYVNGGHDPPVLVDGEGKIKILLEPTGPAFGFTTDIPCDVEVIEFLPGDVLLTFTDGLTDARNISNKFYSEERLLRQVAQKWPSAFSTVKHLEFDVFSHIGHQPQFDDITMVVLRRCIDNKKNCHTFTQKAEMKSLPYFRSFAVEVCPLMRVGENISENLKLIIDEVCSNLIMHGYKGMEVGSIGLTLRVLKDKVLVQIKDTGHPFDPSFMDQPDSSDDINKREIGGLGLYFVKKITDELSYESKNGVNLLSMTINY